MSTTIWWIRRDLRLQDNPALAAAQRGGRTVVPVFVIDERLLRGPASSRWRNQFLFAGLAGLDATLRRLGSRLVLRRGDPADQLRRLRQETDAQAIYAEVDYSPFARRRDSVVASGLPIEWVHGVTIHPPELVVRVDGMPFTVFGAFRRAWKALPLPTSEGLLPAPLALPSPSALECEPLPQFESPPGFPAGETEAQRRLDAFLGGPVHRYDSGRNRLDQDGTSALSPYLRFGMLSARTAVVKAYQARDAARAAEGREAIEAWIDELIWRDFYMAVLSRFPHLERGAFRPSMDRICWENDAALLDAWKSGRTGYPVVDAAMRQLLQSGWMHNRARMIVASFLTKDLLMDWRLGERWFRQNLIDGDPAANIGGWQWTAGTGTDAAPYFRVFNPVLQGAKFDPQGAFVRRYVPELANVPAAFIHRPWKMPLERQAELGCLIGRDYPAPVVEHAWARERALLAYRTAASDAARQRPPGNEYTQRRSS